jgi:hypothetical protein
MKFSDLVYFLGMALLSKRFGSESGLRKFVQSLENNKDRRKYYYKKIRDFHKKAINLNLYSEKVKLIDLLKELKEKIFGDSATVLIYDVYNDIK